MLQLIITGSSLYMVLILLMLQTTSDLSIKDHQSERNQLTSQQLSLPLISKKPVSRGEPANRRIFAHNDVVKFPNIHSSQPEIDSPTSFVNFRNAGEKVDKNLFAEEVKQKLHMVLGQMGNRQTLEEGEDSEDEDFEAKINENKELIKRHKQQKGSENAVAAHPSEKLIADQKQKYHIKSRNQSLYQKRVKQYRDQSSENRYLQKRKQTIKDRIQQQPANNAGAAIAKQNSKEKPRNDYGSVRDKNQGKRPAPKNTNNNQRVLSQKSSQKNVAAISKNVNLFDGIQNFLANPAEGRKEKVLVGLTLLKAKRDIEDKIRSINQKLGLNQGDEKQHSSNHELKQKQSILLNSTAREWHRVAISASDLTVQPSTFDKQLQKITTLQERSSACLEKYLENQKVLMQLQLRRQQLPRKVHASSH